MQTTKIKMNLEKLAAITFFIAVISLFSSCKNITEYIYKNTFTVNFYANGGTGKMEAQTFVQDTEQALTKNGFTGPNGRVFAGWATDQNSGEKVYDDNQYVKITKNLKLYAIWKMYEGSGTATESKEWIFDSWMDESVKPGDDFYKYVVGNWAKDPNAVGYWYKKHKTDDEGILNNQLKFADEFMDEIFLNSDSKIAKNYPLLAKAAELLPVTDEKKAAEFEIIKQEIQKIDQITNVDDLLRECINILPNCFSIFHIYTSMYTRTDMRYEVEFDWYLQNAFENTTEPKSFKKFLEFMYVSNQDIFSEELKKILNIDNSKEKEFLQSLYDFYEGLKIADPSVDNADKKIEGLLEDFINKNGIKKMPVISSSLFGNMNLIGLEGKDKLSFENAKNMLKFVVAVNDLNIVINYKDKIKQEEYHFPLVKAFIDTYDPDGSRKEYLNTMCEELRAKFEERLQNNTWMSKSSKESAIKKLKEIYFLCGYPDTLPQEFLFEEDFSKYKSFLEFDRAITYKTELASFNHFIDDSISLKDKMFIRMLLDVNPIDANAYCFQTLNTVNILITMLTGEITRPELPDAYNYGGIGYIIGHELCHSFDASGSKYDENGDSRDWWAVSDKLRYEEKKEQMIQLYNMFTLETDSFTNVNGEQTLTENMADFGGFTVCYDLFVSKKIKEGFSGEELIKQKKMFFNTLSIVWSNTRSIETTINDILTDEHSPRRFRPIGITCLMDDWYDLYNVQPGDRYYLEPNQRIVLW